MVNILLKRSSDDEPVEISEAASCALYNYDMYANETDGVDRIYPDEFTLEASMDDNGDDKCIMTIQYDGMEPMQHNLSACDCTNPTDYVNGMEDPGMFFEILTIH